MIRLLLLLLSSAPAFAQDLSWELKPSTTTAQLGEPVAIDGTVESNATDDLKLDMAATATDYFSLTSVSRGETEVKGVRHIQHFRLEVVPLALGRLPITTVWTLARQGSTRSYRSPPVELEITEPPLGAQPQLKDIKGPRAAMGALWPWLLAAALGWLAYELYRRRRRGRSSGGDAVPPAEDPRPPDEIARSRLDALEASGLWAAGRAKDFYIELTDILRQYLERRFGLPATRLTTGELHRGLRRAAIERSAGGALKDMLDRADLVKFAKIRPEADWGGRDLSQARAIVEQTTPKDLAASGARA